jgi:hypothetical protein
VQIAQVLRPTSLAFAPDGTLYVTAAGRIESRTPEVGLLIRMTGEM